MPPYTLFVLASCLRSDRRCDVPDDGHCILLFRLAASLSAWFALQRVASCSCVETRGLDWVQVLMENRMLEAQVMAHRESRLAAARSLLQNIQVQMPLHPHAPSQVFLLPCQSLWLVSSHSTRWGASQLSQVYPNAYITCSLGDPHHGALHGVIKPAQSL